MHKVIPDIIYDDYLAISVFNLLSFVVEASTRLGELCDFCSVEVELLHTIQFPLAPATTIFPPKTNSRQFSPFGQYLWLSLVMAFLAQFACE